LKKYFCDRCGKGIPKLEAWGSGWKGGVYVLKIGWKFKKEEGEMKWRIKFEP